MNTASYEERFWAISWYVLKALQNHGDLESSLAVRAVQRALDTPGWPTAPVRSHEDRPVKRPLLLPGTDVTRLVALARDRGVPLDALMDLALAEYLDEAGGSGA